MDLVFEWDEGKNSANREKHRVSFEEARGAFLDENARVLPDPEHFRSESKPEGATFVSLVAAMKKHYDFSKSVKNPYLRKPKKQLTIRLDEDTIDYFRALAEKNGIPYQNLINLYLRDCAQSNRKLSMKWE